MSALPLTIAVLPKNGRENVHVALTIWEGRSLFDARAYYQSGDEWKPGRGGLSLQIAQLPAFAEAVQAALAEAKASGLIGDAP